MKKLKIALFCTNEFASPLRKDVIYAPLPLFEELVMGLADQGHEVFLYTAADSTLTHKNITVISGNLVSFKEAGYKNMWGMFHDQEVVAVYEQMLIAQMVEDSWQKKFDVMHFYHSIIHALPLLKNISIPVVTTLHDPINDKRKFILENCAWRNNINYVSISNNQRKDLPSLNFLNTIYNGIDLEKYSIGNTPEDYFVFLGRVSPEKGTHLAVQAAHKGKFKLKVIGPNWGGEEYWKKEIEPYWNDEHMEFLGQLPQAEAHKILAKAKGLLFTSQWEEPFGLVMIEAMALGVPVIGWNKGSVPEVISDGKTGFLVNSIDSIIDATQKIDRISRAECRDHVEKNFSLTKMITEYESAYAKLIK